MRHLQQEEKTKTEDPYKNTQFEFMRKLILCKNSIYLYPY